ncbi:hypothetical protein D3C72_2135100 [compost metagenome]
MVMVATIRSITRNGSMIRKPISKPRRISEIMKAGTTARRSTLSSTTTVWPFSLAISMKSCRSLSRVLASMNSRNGSAMRGSASVSVIWFFIKGSMPSRQARSKVGAMT